MAKNVATETAVERKTHSVSTSLPKAKFEALDDHRWDRRKKMGEILTEAVDLYIEKYNVPVAQDEEAPATGE